MNKILEKALELHPTVAPPPGYEEYIRNRFKSIQERFPGLEASFTKEEQEQMDKSMAYAGRFGKFKHQFAFLDYYEWALEAIESNRKIDKKETVAKD